MNLRIYWRIWRIWRIRRTRSNRHHHLFALSNVTTLDGLLRSTVGPRRFNLQLAGLLAMAAVFVATIGTYGVVAYSTDQRLKEIGIRIALGGSARHVLAIILADGVWMAVAGTAAGVLVARGVGQLARTMLYGITPLDPLSYALAALVVIVMTLAACSVPALRAFRLNPVSVLRSE